MKTPREILFQKHEAAGPKLDIVRAEILGEQRWRPQRTRTGSALRLWQELVWPCRRVWWGLAAVWVVILGLNGLTHDPARVAARFAEPLSPQALALLRQQRLLAELAEPDSAEPSEPPRRVPRPRSDRRAGWLIG
jgi:hypothetical protein